MGIAELLTVVFIALKLLGVIDWSWWLVLLPEIIAVALYILNVILVVSAQKRAEKRFDEHWKNF